MNLMDLIGQAGGGESLGNLGGALGLDASDTGALVGALAPALMRGMQKQTESAGGLAGLTNALDSGKHQQYLDKPDLISASSSIADGNGILGHLFGSKDVSRNVATQAAQTTGIDVGLIKKALPMLAGLAMGAVSKNRDSGDSSGSLLGGMLGGLVGDSGGSDGFDLDDVLGLAKKLF
jgi:hypothetical protein